MGQAVQLLGALLVMSAYMAWSQNRLKLDSVQFLGLNLAGAGILSAVAAVNGDWGFLLLEGMWTWVSARGFRRALKARREAKQAAKRQNTGRFTRPARRRSRHNPLRRV